MAETCHTLFTGCHLDRSRPSNPRLPPYPQVDYAVECYTPEYQRAAAYVGLMLLAFPVGIPLLFAYVLNLSCCFHHRLPRVNAASPTGQPV